MSAIVKKYSKAISELCASSNFLDSNSFIEIENELSSYKTPLSALNSKMISTYALYNNMEDIFNNGTYISDVYFGQDTYFKFNPYVHKETNDEVSYDGLRNDQSLITRKLFEEYMDDVGICVPILNPTSKYYYYDYDITDWKEGKDKFPLVMSYQRDSIWTVKSNLKFDFYNDTLFVTPEVEAPKNIMLDVCGNIFLDSEYDPEWYEKQNYHVGLSVNGKVVTMSFLKNILKIDDYTIAQFHFHCPLADGTIFRIFTNANCMIFTDAKESEFERKLFSGMNAVNLSFYC